MHTLLFTNIIDIDSDGCVLRDSDIEKCKMFFYARKVDRTTKTNRRRLTRVQRRLIDFHLIRRTKSSRLGSRKGAGGRAMFSDDLCRPYTSNVEQKPISDPKLYTTIFTTAYHDVYTNKADRCSRNTFKRVSFFFFH